MTERKIKIYKMKMERGTEREKERSTGREIGRQTAKTEIEIMEKIGGEREGEIQTQRDKERHRMC